jgi:hypothetical protein
VLAGVEVDGVEPRCERVEELGGDPPPGRIDQPDAVGRVVGVAAGAGVPDIEVRTDGERAGGAPGGGVGFGATTRPRNVTVSCSPGRVPCRTTAVRGPAVSVGVGVGLGDGKTIGEGTNDGISSDGWGIDTEGPPQSSVQDSCELWAFRKAPIAPAAMIPPMNRIDAIPITRDHRFCFRRCSSVSGGGPTGSGSGSGSLPAGCCCIRIHGRRSARSETVSNRRRGSFSSVPSR